MSWEHGGRRLRFRSEVDADDRPNGEAQRLVRHRWTVEVPEGFDLDTTHPDLVALAALLVVHPFVGRRIVFPVEVSEEFAAAAGYDVEPVHPGIRARKPGTWPGLAYSGGIDSTAALAVMPSSTVAIFMERTLPRGLAVADAVARRAGFGSSYRADASLHAVQGLRDRGVAAHALTSDLPFVRRPVGFPVDLATAVPAILSADRFDLGSMAWGTVLESAYRIGHHHFEDYRDRWHWRHWSRVFASVGLPMNPVTAGMSEVATMAVVMASPYAHLAASCDRGTVGAPCLTCWKCFRKTLVEHAVWGGDPSPELLDRLFEAPDAVAELQKIPIKHENVLAFATGRYRGNHRIMRLLRARTRGDRLPLDWMTRWYPPSAELLPQEARGPTVAAIGGFLQAMDSDDEAKVRSWDLGSALGTEEYRRNAAALARALR